MYISKAHKRKNGWWRLSKQGEPIIVSSIIFADNQEDAIQIAKDQAIDGFVAIDSPYWVTIHSIETASALFIDDGSEPSGILMRESSHLDHNEITECEEYD